MKTVTKIGDVFAVNIDNGRKKYFQYIANDLTQLNSDVIRAFQKVYLTQEKPGIEDIITDKVDFYAHVTTKLGVKMNLWKRVGNSKTIGETNHIIFKDTHDYGSKIGAVQVEISHRWYIWKINDRDFNYIGKLEEPYKKAYTGLVINPLGIIEMLKGNKYPINYPE